MTDHSDHLPPSDVCLLLRAHAEQHWLTREVAPLVRELSDGDPLSQEELGAATAYLEMVWIEACRHAAETDAAHAELEAAGAPDGTLNRQARGYRAAVRAMRDELADGVAELIAGAEVDFTGEPAADALAHDEARRRADCIRSGQWRPGSTYSRTRLTQTARSSAGEVVQRAADAGVQLLALSDHDTVDGVDEALAAGQRLGVHVVPAVEISVVDDGAASPRELHLLGYRIDHTDPAFARALADFLADREQRTLRMAAALSQLGLALDEREISARVADGQPIGRPHLAQAVLAEPANAARLADEHIDDIGSLIRAYLIEGRPAFALRETPTFAEAVAAIHAAGGVAVWAHPFWDISDAEQVLASIERFRALGVDGVEAFYVTHTREQTELLAQRCDELSLLSTGSSDFHGPDNRLFSRFLAFETYGLAPNLGPIAALPSSASSR